MHRSLSYSAHWLLQHGSLSSVAGAFNRRSSAGSHFRRYAHPASRPHTTSVGASHRSIAAAQPSPDTGFIRQEIRRQPRSPVSCVAFTSEATAHAGSVPSGPPKTEATAPTVGAAGESAPTTRRSKSLQPAAVESSGAAEAAVPGKRVKRATPPKVTGETELPGKGVRALKGKAPRVRIPAPAKAAPILHAEGTPDPAFSSPAAAEVSHPTPPVTDDSTMEIALEALHRPMETQDGVLRPVVLIGIDPDASGALAVVQWRDGSAFSDAQRLQHTVVDLHDMPMMRVQVGQRSRNQMDAAAIVHLLRGSVLPGLPPGARLRAVLEQPVPNSLNGKQSWWSSGFAYGVWQGVLCSLGIQIQTISARAWKLDMGLNKKGKEGSRELALALYPQCADMMKRKKDHGRAEALLIAAWAAGGIPTPQVAAEAGRLSRKSAPEIKETNEVSVAPQTPVVLESLMSLEDVQVGCGPGTAAEEHRQRGVGSTEDLESAVLPDVELVRSSAAASRVAGAAPSDSGLTGSAPGGAHLTQQPEPAPRTMSADQEVTARGVAPGQQGFSATELAAKIEAVKHRMQAEAKPEEADSVAAFLRAL